ncbi:MAG: carbon-phosphorus lyase complex subunit PhnI [Deltaproteobacteria bacterium]|nr:carbon-phosphorus lyase complex subunit PhnI [Candidatus Anaeroferrophillus wilburensis]MBN2890188.1 carbon-phosphorus lyase complex subunit PhnI [Deltaproteobacteria bacterium]
MSYVAVKGGSQAIGAAKKFLHDMLSPVWKLDDGDLRDGLTFAIDRIMGEGALYAPKLALEALKRAGGDVLEASIYLRAHRSSCQRIGNAAIVESAKMRLIRRISATFKDISGGQLLGPSSDYEVRLLGRESGSPTTDHLLEASAITGRTDDHTTIVLASALQPLRDKDMIMELPNLEEKPHDVTRTFPLPPYPRSAIMQIMARGETGAMLAFSYTSMRGYGDVHPTIGDLRLGTLKITFIHPFTNRSVAIGEIRVTACETVGTFVRSPVDGEMRLATGYGFCLGYNETKAISMSILDLAMNYAGFSVGGTSLATEPEMIIHHVDAIESMGFANHFKLPHYVTFQADIQVYEKARRQEEGKNG